MPAVLQALAPAIAQIDAAVSKLSATTVDPANSSITEPASLLTPVWVTAANMQSTVVADSFDTAAQICAIAGQAACSAAGIH